MKLSILIPASHEEHLQKTIYDIYTNKTDDTEVIVALDNWENPPNIFADKILFTKLGQRGATNALAKIASGEYVMKVDAHTSFSKGFDTNMLENIQPDSILAPLMGVLDPISWTINGKKMTSRYCFGKDFVMKYDIENGNPETMCLQGSAWMISKENYFKWNVCDETLGSWGGQAVELGIAAWLNGGKCMTTTEAYYGHVFRHKDEEFPYDRGENPGKYATLELKRRYENDPRVHELAKKFGIDF